MSTTPDPTADPEAVHGWFGLTYSNYLVLPRTLMQSMPAEWQERMVAVLEEIRAAYRHVEQADSYHVQAGVWAYPNELTHEQLKAAGWTTEHGGPSGAEVVYYDPDGQEHDGHSATVFIPCDDPIPHYNRGRTYIAPAELDPLRTCPRCGTSWTADIDACPQCTRPDAPAASEPASNLRARLADHYLAQIVCDHDRAMDNPICACSRVHLGWHPSVGAAVAAWIDHVLVVEALAASEPETPMSEPRICGHQYPRHPLDAGHGRVLECQLERGHDGPHIEWWDETKIGRTEWLAIAAEPSGGVA